MQREQKKLTYKIAQGVNDGATLQSALVKAITKFSKPAKRLEPMGPSGSEVRFIAFTRTNRKAFIGVFHKLTKGRAQEVIEMVSEGDEWPVHLVTAKTADKESREFIEGTLFFTIWKNHVVVHQTNACRADSFQEHLSWLLSRAANDSNEDDSGVAEEIVINLADPVPPSIRKKSKFPVKRIRLGDDVQSKASSPSKSESKPTHSRLFFAPTGKLWGGIVQILEAMGAPVPRDLKLTEPLGDNDLKVTMDVYCTKKKAESGAGQLLNAVRTALSHVDKSKFSIELADGSKINAEEMKVGKNFGVECVDGHPVHQNIFKCMLEYMAMLVEDDVIIEDEPFGNVN